MYVPKHHEVADLRVLHGLIRARPLGAWVMQGQGELIANHLPFLLDEARGEFGVLMAHVARENPVWRTEGESLVIFQGVDSYISPSWYPSKHVHGKAVPTWNYAVVHAYGAPQAIEDREWLRQHVAQLSAAHEAGEAAPWRAADAPADYMDRLLDAIVGIEIPIRKLVGKWKVSQNRSEADKRGVIAALEERGDDASREMAALVAQHLPTAVKPTP